MKTYFYSGVIRRKSGYLISFDFHGLVDTDKGAAHAMRIAYKTQLKALEDMGGTEFSHSIHIESFNVVEESK